MMKALVEANVTQIFIDPSRQKAVRFSYFGTLIVALWLSACGGGGGTAGDNPTPDPEPPRPLANRVEFTHMSAPQTDEERATLQATSQIQIFADSDLQSEEAFEYDTLLLSDAVINSKRISGVEDITGTALFDSSVDGTSVQFFSNTPDANTLLKVAGTADEQLHLLTHFQTVSHTNFEYTTDNTLAQSQFGLFPMHIGLSVLTQNQTTGPLSVADHNRVDFSVDMPPINGLWIPAGGSVSTTNSHLGVEQMEPDARAWELSPDPDVADTALLSSFLSNYYDDVTRFGASAPYHYGHAVEVKVLDDGGTETVKHYGFGRISRRTVQVMPDGLTWYMGDTAPYGVLLMYIGDVNAGTLYAAHWEQLPDSEGGNLNGGAATITWVQLGEGAGGAVKALVDSGTTFSSIFSTAEEATTDFTTIKTNNQVEYLQLNELMETPAAFLETRRYAAMLGATTEFNAITGIAVNAADKLLYLAISDITGGMLPSTLDPADHIQVQQIRAGVVYELVLDSGQKDSRRRDIASEYVATSMRAVTSLIGEDLPVADEVGNTSDVEKVANPDTLKFSENLRTLFIAENGRRHINNFLWAWQADIDELSRVMSVPAGAGVSGLQVVDDINGFSYLMANYQHPGLYATTMPADLQIRLNALINKRQAAIGYFQLPQL